MVRTDYVIQHRTAYFCQEGMFVLLMIRFPFPQIPVPYIYRAAVSREPQSSVCARLFFFFFCFTTGLKYGP